MIPLTTSPTSFPFDALKSALFSATLWISWEKIIDRIWSFSLKHLFVEKKPLSIDFSIFFQTTRPLGHCLAEKILWRKIITFVGRSLLQQKRLTARKRRKTMSTKDLGYHWTVQRKSPLVSRKQPSCWCMPCTHRLVSLTWAELFSAH